MAYLAKSTVLKAYQLLSDIDSDKRQGLTQKVSVLKYASALDIYFKIHNQNCDLKQSSNRDLFASYVGEIVKINNEYCTKDFFLSVSSNGRDFDCGSNFFSQTSVKDSKTNPYTVFLYPKRSGWQPVMDVQNQELIYRSDYLLDIFSFYLGSSELRLAFIVWLLRFAEIAEDNMDGIKSALNNLFTNEYCDALYTDAVNLSDTSYIEFDEKMCELTPDDIQSLFNAHEELSCEKTTLTDFPLQTIFYGAPGTGKSYKVKSEKLAGVPEENIFRTTFHPDYDYASFVGCYKPKAKGFNMLAGENLTEEQLLQKFSDSANGDDKKAKYLYEALIRQADMRHLGIDKNSLSSKLKDKGFSNCTYVPECDAMGKIYDYLVEDGYVVENKITYSFIPQVFTKAYIKAWEIIAKDEKVTVKVKKEDGTETEQEIFKPVYLVIEEINRGNCAQIFGDIFQLLDRNENGYSEYPIDIDEDLKNYLVQQLGADSEGIKDGKLCLPPNLNLLATMNTSDQSLFPMDSAFKRRWDWEFVPIRYTAAEAKDDKDDFHTFTITIDDKHHYLWTDFLQKVNEKILSVTDSEDKQMGEYFIKKSADYKTFINKVMYYLWSEVGKDLYGSTNPFFVQKTKNENGQDVENQFSFNDLFKENATQLLQGFMKKLEVPEVKIEEEKAATEAGEE